MSRRLFSRARILIVDDEATNVALLRRLLERAGFTRVVTTCDPREAKDLYVEFRPDLIVLDLHMPHLDGLAVMEQLNQIAEATYLPILILTGDLSPEARREALSRGAKDFLQKPFGVDEVLLRIGTLLETRFLYLQIQTQNQMLEAKVRERTRELEAAQIEIIERLGLDQDLIRSLRVAGLLHDVGKIGIPDTILLKLGKLSGDEFDIVKTHTTIGARILSGSRFPILRLAEEIAFSHHERWDGNGYAGMSGDKIPLPGRIVAVADVFDALTQQRPYKAAWPIAEAMGEIDRQRGRQFDPSLVDAFLRILERRKQLA